MQSDSLIGAVVDTRYSVIARLGRGGMATVYRAHDARLDRDVAVKMMHPYLAEQPGFVERFNREARAAARLTSPYVVGVYDQGVWDSPLGPQAFLVMEYVAGPDVRSELTRLGSFNLGTALELTRQILAALAAAHHAGLIHRDVKPENILLTSPLPPVSVFQRPEIHAKVADFGLARAASSVTTASTTMGTVAYIAPEIVTNQKAGAPSDVYAVGIMLYEFLTGSLPFHAATPIATAYQHINAPMPPVAEHAEWLPPAVDSFIGLLTAKNPADRPADGAAALAALDDLVKATPEEGFMRRIPVIPTQPAPPAATRRLESATRLAAFPPPQATQSLEDAPAGTATRSAPAAGLFPKQAGSPPPQHASRTGKKSPLTRKRRVVGWLTAILIVLLAAAGAWYFLIGPGHRVAIPNVAGKPYASAAATLKDAGLSPLRSDEYSDTVAQGAVVGTSPKAGQSINPSQDVTVIVSRGVEQVTVPDVSGMTESEAKAALTDARLAMSVTEAYSETIPEGSVISQNPSPTSEVDHDSTVSVVISKGRQPIDVPSVIGDTKDDAVAAIDAAGLQVTVTEDFSDTVDKGVVISQNPASGTVYKGDTITITVSKGPEMVEVPNVRGKTEAEARQILEDAGFKVEKSVLGGLGWDIVYSQDPAAGEQIPRGSTVTLVMI